MRQLTIYVKVSAIDGQKVTLLVGEMNIDSGMFGENFANGEMPSMGTFPDMGSGEIPPFPDDGSFPGGQVPGGAFPDGSMPDMGGFSGMPEGGGWMPNGSFPDRMGNLQLPFVETGDTITLTLNTESVKTLSIGSLVEITFGEGGSVLSLNVIDGRMQGEFGDGGYMTPPPRDTDNSNS